MYWEKWKKPGKRLWGVTDEGDFQEIQRRTSIHGNTVYSKDKNRRYFEADAPWNPPEPGDSSATRPLPEGVDLWNHTEALWPDEIPNLRKNWRENEPLYDSTRLKEDTDFSKNLEQNFAKRQRLFSQGATGSLEGGKPSHRLTDFTTPPETGQGVADASSPFAPAGTKPLDPAQPGRVGATSRGTLLSRPGRGDMPPLGDSGGQLDNDKAISDGASGQVDPNPGKRIGIEPAGTDPFTGRSMEKVTVTSSPEKDSGETRNATFPAVPIQGVDPETGEKRIAFMKGVDPRVTPEMATFIERIAEDTGMTFLLSATHEGKHYLWSNHYDGLAVDVAAINGIPLNAAKRNDNSEECRKAKALSEQLQVYLMEQPGAREVYGPALNMRQLDFGGEWTENAGVTAKHRGHIHIAIQGPKHGVQWEEGAPIRR